MPSSVSKCLPPRARRLVITALMLAAILQVLDTTIVNVALPHMSGSLGTSNDQISWVLTSYIIASAIFMPLTGYFSDVLGRKKYLLISIGGFVFFSALCGAAENLTQIIIFRLLQGVFGAALVPLSQSIMIDIHSPEDRTKALALWSMGVMIGPILGPTIGGYLTDLINWRWNFYINVPVGCLSLILAWNFVPDTAKKLRPFDWVGMALMGLSIGSLQYFLDRGNKDDWFDSTGICLAALLTILGGLFFSIHYLQRKKFHIVDLSSFKDRNFAISSILLGMFGLGLYGAMVILPQILENLLNYPVLTTGLVMAPRGFSSMIAIFVVSKAIRVVSARTIIASGILITTFGIWLGTFYNFNIDPNWVIGPIILQGFGLGLIFTPLATVAFSTLPAHARAEASGLFSLLRTVGSSLGISIVETLLVRQNQRSWNELGGFITPYNPAVKSYLESVNADPTSPLGAQLLQQELLSQSQMVAFINIFKFITWSFLCMLPFLLFLKRNKKKQEKVEIPGE